MNFDLNTLNDEQLKAVIDIDGAVMVTAGAGSGKTRLLTHRIAYLIQEKQVRPYQILAITFTNKAANEMKERLAQMVSYASDIWVSTFHSMCVRILRRNISILGFTANFSIFGEDEKERILKALIKQSGCDPDEYLKKIIRVISDAKNRALSHQEYLVINGHQEEMDYFCDIYAQYQAELKRQNALDYDDLLFYTYILLSQYAEIQQYYQEKFLYICVDEFQDTNLIQYLLIKLISNKSHNILVVGDEDQCIYGWRGANIENIYNFRKDFGCKEYKLEQNYRSTQNILNLANKLIAHNASRLEKNLWTTNEAGKQVEFVLSGDEGNEADSVVSRIMRYVKEGYKYSDIAVLMRLNALTRSFEERFMQYGIPHKIFGGFKFYDRKEIKDLLAYLKVLANAKDDEALIRIINFPKRGIGDGTIAHIRNSAISSNRSMTEVILDLENNSDLSLSVIKKVTGFSQLLNYFFKENQYLALPDLVANIIKTLEYDRIFSDDTEENVSRKSNINEFANSVKQFSDSNEGATLEDYLQMITLYSDTEEMDDGNYVNLATVHSAKGLEFKIVFIIGLEDGIFPINRASDSLDDLEEERRLLYVAITRAKCFLHMSKAQTRFLYGQRKYTMPSRFLKDVGIEFAPKPQTSYGQREAQPLKPPIQPTVVPTATRNEGVDLNIFKVGSVVLHKKFGLGTIRKISGEHNNLFAVIEFEAVGTMTLALAYAPLTVQ